MDSDRDGKPTWPLLSVVDKKFLYQCHHRKAVSNWELLTVRYLAISIDHNKLLPQVYHHWLAIQLQNYGLPTTVYYCGWNKGRLSGPMFHSSTQIFVPMSSK